MAPSDTTHTFTMDVDVVADNAEDVVRIAHDGLVGFFDRVPHIDEDASSLTTSTDTGEADIAEVNLTVVFDYGINPEHVDTDADETYVQKEFQTILRNARTEVAA